MSVETTHHAGAAFRAAETFAEAIRTMPEWEEWESTDGGGASCVGSAQSATGDLQRTFTPHVVITFGPDGIPVHRDHLAVHQLVTTAFHEWRAALPLCCDPRHPPTSLP